MQRLLVMHCEVIFTQGAPRADMEAINWSVKDRYRRTSSLDLVLILLCKGLKFCCVHVAAVAGGQQSQVTPEPALTSKRR